MTNPPRQTPPLVPGYEIIRLIGLGGMGEVYLARQRGLNRLVAIKFLARIASEPVEDDDRKFRREAELMARVSHPNVLTILDFGTAEDRSFLVLEYVENGDLRSRMVPDSPMKVDEIRTIMGPVIRAVGYLHRQGILHRDLKPENILIHHEDIPKVADFGIAVLKSATRSLTRTGRTLGTPGYVAPEQQYGLRVDERADQFSRAALCYELATGRKPLGAYSPPVRLNPRLGSKAGVAILKALSDDPSDRFATVAEFGEALDQGLIRAGSRRVPRSRARLVAGLAVLISMVSAILILLAGPFFAHASRSDLRPSPTRTRPSAPATSLDSDRSQTVARVIDRTLVKIPSGEFWMGSDASDPAAQPDERPRHLVRITRPFYLGEKEVNVGQCRQFVEARHDQTSAENPSEDGKHWGGCMDNVKLGRWEQKPTLNWRLLDGVNPASDDDPVGQVSYEDAVAFCNAISKVENRTYRLPTEAEWEDACRAGSQTHWFSGNDPESLQPFAWTLKNAGHSLHRVGTKKPNPFSLHDIHGNVWEWCSDYFGESTDTEAVNPQGPLSGEARVLRGGSIDWNTVERTRSASRLHYPSHMSYFNYGFRICSSDEP